MDVRSYDPAIGRFTSIDPVVHHEFSTYQAFDNNPAFWADPSGADGEHYNWETERYENDKGEEVSFDTALASVGLNADGSESSGDGPDDDITVNKKGIVTNVVKNDKPNRFFDEDGTELFFNDGDGVDNVYSQVFSYAKGDRLFYGVSDEEMYNQIFSSGIITQRWMAKYGGVNSGGFYLWSLFSARAKSQGDFDFAEGYLAHLIKNPGRNDTKGRANYNEDAGFFRFGNSNNIYNLYDGGNFMWGRAMRLSGFSYGEIRGGSQLNEGFGDSEADQRAIKNGANGN